MTKHTNILTALVLAAGALAASVSGCELIASVDRSLIPGGSGGSGGGTSMSTGGSDAGTSCDGAMACSVPTDCATPDTLCVAQTCTAGCCGTSNASAGTTCTDNNGKLCDGNGNCVACLMPTDCAAQATACVTNTCTGNVCGTSNASAGTTCSSTADGGAGDKLCDGNGHCLECNAPADCPAQTTACITNTCTGNVCGTSNASAGTTCSSTADGGAGDKLCDGNGHCGECNAPTDCPMQSTECITNTCTGNVCGTSNATTGTTCTDNNGTVCNGSGTCVECNAPTDCAIQSTKCITNTCTGNACGTSNAPSGTACNDSNGTVCNGNGNCVACVGETDVDCGGPNCAPCADGLKCLVNTDCIDKVCDPTAKTCTPASCTDGVQNGMETDVDCGGATCDGLGDTCADKKHCEIDSDCANDFCFGANGTTPGTCVSCSDGVQDGNETGTDCGGAQCDAQGKTCPAGQGCETATDCQSGFCQGNTTCELRPNGQSCTGDAQCANGNCIGPSGNQICCSSACNGNCQACTFTFTGLTNGTCGNITAGMPAPAGQCTTSTTCGNDGNCAAGGTCEQEPTTVSCQSAVCSNGQLTPAANCTGTGTCAGGSASACPGSFICANATACKTACASNSDCQGTGLTCQNPGAGGTCVVKTPLGGACTSTSQCVSGVCDATTDECCSAACIGGVCGATSCNTSGTCVYPGNSVAPPSLQTPGDCQKIVCAGNGSITSIDDPTDLPTSNSACLTNPTCAGEPSAPSFTDATTGTPCTLASDPHAQVCGDTSNSNIAGTCVECNTTADCNNVNDAGTLSCNSNFVCQ
jgi:hypothetical protein